MLKQLHFTITLVFTVLTLSLTAQKHADCATAMDICEKKNYNINKASGEGRDLYEAEFMSCFMNGNRKAGSAEENSTWIKFEVAQSGSLSFTIKPHQKTDDIDFVVYRLGDGTCKTKQVVRCMAAGAAEEDANSPCMGATGLRAKESDYSEDAGCSEMGDNTWLAPLKAIKGEKYMILVSNVTTEGPGFSISFSGSAMLPCDIKKPAKKITPPPQPLKPVPSQPSAVVAPKPQPNTIGGRDVEIGEELKVKSRKIKVKIWDSQIEDGDIISIYIDQKLVKSRIYLRLKPQEFEFDLSEGKEHYLTVYADDFGKAEPNTAMISINDGFQDQIIDLVAGRKKQESVRIVVE